MPMWWTRLIMNAPGGGSSSDEGSEPVCQRVLDPPSMERDQVGRQHVRVHPVEVEGLAGLGPRLAPPEVTDEAEAHVVPDASIWVAHDLEARVRVDADQSPDRHLVAGLLAHLALDRRGHRLSDLHGASREAPLAAVRASHQEEPAVVEGHRRHARPNGLGLGPVGLDLHSGSQRTPMGGRISNAAGARAGRRGPPGGPRGPHFSPSRLKAGTGFRNPLSASAPTGSAETSCSTTPRTRPEIRIW